MRVLAIKRNLKMKNKEFLSNYRQLSNIKVDCFPLTYAIIKNQALMQSHAESLEKMISCKVEGEEAFEEARVTLCEKMSEKDEKGNPKMITASAGRHEYSISDRPAFNLALKALYENPGHSEYLKAKEKQAQDLNGLMNEKAPDVPWYNLKSSRIPDSISLLRLDVVAIAPFLN